MKIANSIALLFFSPLFFFACQTNADTKTAERTLPYYGFKDVEMVTMNGETVADTLYHVIDNFYFTAHSGEAITHETVKGKVYVADFFFTYCPTICPVMTDNMKGLHERTKDIDELLILSHTIDPTRDSLERLNQYIQERDIDTRDDWFFLRGSQAYTYDIGKDAYLINAMVDREAEGGFLHSEQFVLIDREGHIRGMYVGTDTASVNQLEKDIRFLIDTYDN